jgi:L-ascorbate metabolism protein UlaG (beta-lactamase superfamily)
LKSRDITIVTDPYDSKVVGQNLGKPVADIVTVSHGDPGHNNVAAVGGTPKLIEGAGEYEIRGVFITGIQTYHDAEGGKKRGKNTVYLFELEDLVVCHLGDLGHPLTPAQAEAMSNVEVLLIPVGGASTITTAQAAEVISLIEPKVTVPMQYRVEPDGGMPDSVERFCRELGVGVPAPQPKLVLTRSSLPEETQVVLLEARKA